MVFPASSIVSQTSNNQPSVSSQASVCEGNVPDEQGSELCATIAQRTLEYVAATQSGGKLQRPAKKGTEQMHMMWEQITQRGLVQARQRAIANAPFTELDRQLHQSVRDDDIQGMRAILHELYVDDDAVTSAGLDRTLSIAMGGTDHTRISTEEINLEMMQVIIGTAPAEGSCTLSSEALDQALCRATNFNRPEMVEVIVQATRENGSSKITPPGSDAALGIAVRVARKEIVNQILQKTNVTSKGLDKALSIAVRDSYANPAAVVQSILEGTPAGNRVTREGLEEALDRIPCPGDPICYRLISNAIRDFKS